MPFGTQRKANSEKRRLAAIFCLLAVVMLQAPFARAAWISSAMNCCMGDHCPIPGHHQKSANTETEMPMDGGQGGRKMSDGKIWFCKTRNKPPINVQQLVMPIR